MNQIQEASLIWHLRNQMLLQRNHSLSYDSNFSHFKLTANKQKHCSKSRWDTKDQKKATALHYVFNVNAVQLCQVGTKLP